VVLFEGHILGARKQDGTLVIRHVRGESPLATWPVTQSRFKALAYLHSGTNLFTLEFTPSGSRSKKFISNHRLIYHPMTSCPPIRLVLLMAKDSAYAIEDPNAGTTMLSIAMAKYRMVAYLWQAYIAEMMNLRNGERRTFQLENEWKESTLFSQDFLTNDMRSEAPVHAITLDKTLEEIGALSQVDLLTCIETALFSKFAIPKGQKSYFACMILDSVAGEQIKHMSHNFSYGGPGALEAERVNLAVFNDRCLFSYPSSIDRVTAAFSDETPTPNGPEASKWRCASHGIGAHLQQIGRMLGLPKQEFGLTSDECVRLASSFSMYASQHLPELRLHPLDSLRLRHHPTLRSPFGPAEKVRQNTAPALWGVSESALFIGSMAGLIAIEIYCPGDGACQRWITISDKRGHPRFTYQVSLADILKLMSTSRSSPRLSMRPGPYSLRVLTADGQSTPIVDFESVVRRLVAAAPGFKRLVFKSQPVGKSSPGSSTQSVIFPPAKRMFGIVVYHDPGACITGIEFMFEEDNNQLIGNKEGESSKEWTLHINDGEMLMGMEIRVMEQLRGLRLFTSTGRLSPWFGDASGGVE
jgi:hypothetical protein